MSTLITVSGIKRCIDDSTLYSLRKIAAANCRHNETIDQALQRLLDTCSYGVNRRTGDVLFFAGNGLVYTKTGSRLYTWEESKNQDWPF